MKGLITNSKPEYETLIKKMKPGAFAVVNCSTKEYHNEALKAETQGFVIHPFISYLASDGKSIQVSILLLIQKPISEKRMTDNIVKHGVGVLNIDDCRIKGGDKPQAGKRTKTFGSSKEPVSGGEKELEFVANDLGRFPSNLIHDGSDNIINLFPSTKSTIPTVKQKDGGKFPENTIALGLKTIQRSGFNDSGSSSRYFKVCGNQKELESYLRKLIIPKAS